MSGKTVEKKKPLGKAVALLSGGLDSTLAVRTVEDMGYEVTAVNIETPFCNCGTNEHATCQTAKHKGAEATSYRRFYAGPEYINLVKNPKHGYGKNMNICVDCRLYMLSKAKHVMEEIGADFVVTGEVMGQRPKSQTKSKLQMIEKESGLEGKLLRPLSGQLLDPVDAEKEGKIKRDDLLNFSGRNRTPQMELAEKLGIEDYPTPAGGCLLTEKEFSQKLKDAFAHGEDTFKTIKLLKIGRHFRMPDGSKIVAGRDEHENKKLRSLGDQNVAIFTVKGHSSTYVCLIGNLTEDNKKFAGSLAARYSKVNNEVSVDIKWWVGKDPQDEDVEVFQVQPLTEVSAKKYKV